MKCVRAHVCLTEARGKEKIIQQLKIQILNVFLYEDSPDWFS